MQLKVKSTECPPGGHTWDLEGGLEVGSRWHVAELLSCCVAGERQRQLGEGRKKISRSGRLSAYRSVVSSEEADSNPAGMQGFEYLQSCAKKHLLRGACMGSMTASP